MSELAELKYRHARDGDDSALTWEITANAPHGAVGPGGISAARGLPRGIIDADGWAKARGGAAATLNPTDGLVSYTLTVKRGSTTISSVTFAPKATGGVIDVQALVLGGLAQVATAAEVQALGAMLITGDTLLPQVQTARDDALAVAGIKPANTLAALPAAPGRYRILGGAEIGQVYERPSGGGQPVRRPALEAASITLVALESRYTSTTTANPAAPTQAEQDIWAAAHPEQPYVPGWRSTSSGGAVVLRYKPAGGGWVIEGNRLAGEPQVQAAQAATQTTVAGLAGVTATAGRYVTELGVYDIVPDSQGAANGGNRRAVGVPGYVARLNSDRGGLDFTLFRPDTAGNNATQNTAKLNAALKEALTNQEVPDLLIPPGIFRINAPGQAIATANQGRQFRVHGSGIGVSILVQDADADGLTIDMRGTGSATVEDLSLLANANMTTGAAVRILGGDRQPGAIVQRLEVSRTGGATEWAKGISLSGVQNPFLQVLNMNAATRQKFVGIFVENGGQSINVHAVTINGGLYGFWADNHVEPGIEGLKFSQFEAVNVRRGIFATNSVAGYGPTQVSVIGGHINAHEACVWMEGMPQIQLDTVLMYVWGPGNGGDSNGTYPRFGLRADSTGDVQMVNCQVHGVFGEAAYTGALLSNATVGTIYDNIFDIVGPAGTAVDLTATTSGIQVHDNSRRGGAQTVSDAGAGNRVWGNTPLDRDFDDRHLVNAAAMLDIARLRTGTDIVKVLGAADVSAITPAWPGRRLTFQCDGTVKFRHVAGLLLQGGADATISGGGSLTLYHDGDTWREAGRST